MINIGLVVTGFDKGGLEQVVYNLYREYKKNGINAYILCEQENQAGYFIGLLDDVRDFCIFNGDFVEFISYCYKKKITHLHYHYNTCFIEEASKCGIKTIYTMHNVYTWFNDNDIAYRAEKLRYCDEIVAVSTLVKEYFCDRSALPKEFVKVITNGIEIERNDEEIILPKEISREGLEINEGEVVFAQLASFTPVKHQIGLIGVMEEIIRQNSSIKLLLVGNVLDQEYYDCFLRELEKSPAKKNIKIIPYFEHKYVSTFLHKVVDCALLATLQEGCSNFVIEAICSEVPMIVTNVGNAQDVKQIISHVVPAAYDENKRVVMSELSAISISKKNSNTNDIVNAMLDVASNLEKYKKKAKISTDERQKFSSEFMAKKYIELL